MTYQFNEFSTKIFITGKVPSIEKIAGDLNISVNNILVVADENTVPIVKTMCGGVNVPVCVLKSGEENKNWQSAEKILKAAKDASLGRDGLLLGTGGGVIGDICAFAASVYMRGCRLALAATTLLAMVDSSVGGKTGFDLFGIKNLAGTFYPAQAVYMPLDALNTLPQKEFKSGFAELIKTAVLSGGDFLEQLSVLHSRLPVKCNLTGGNLTENVLLLDCIKRAVEYKAGIVSEDLRESGKRMLLNLGHTFAHALESAAGLGNISHGEAVAWGIVRACELGRAAGITPDKRAEKITDLIKSSGYEHTYPHPLAKDTSFLLDAMKSDKKNKDRKLTFIVPDAESARIISIEDDKKIFV